MEYLGAWGTLIHEKNLKSKISCQTPCKGVRSIPLCAHSFFFSQAKSPENSGLQNNAGKVQYLRVKIPGHIQQSFSLPLTL